ncbi:hypothetical protein QJQ45_015506, partial [Haematococcus lacustris]
FEIGCNAMLHLARSCLPPSPAPLRLTPTLRAAAADHDNHTTLLPADHYSSPFHQLELQDLWDGVSVILLPSFTSCLISIAITVAAAFYLPTTSGIPRSYTAYNQTRRALGRLRMRQHVNPLRIEFQSAKQPRRLATFKAVHSRDKNIAACSPTMHVQTVTGPLDWAAEFKDPSRPLVLDLGCGPGRFLLLMHHAQPEDYKDCNFLGVEIREQASCSSPGQPQRRQWSGERHFAACDSMLALYHATMGAVQLVGRANEWAERLGFKSKVVYVHANATVSLASMLATYPGPVQLVCVQFPDPHFKRKHWKRRMLQPEAVEDIVRLLPPGGKLFLQTDVEVVAVALRDVVEQHAFHAFTLDPQHTPSAVFMTEPQQPSAGCSSGGCPSDEEAEEGEGSGFQSQWALGGWLADNPLGVPTEREHMVTQRGLPVYRMLLGQLLHGGLKVLGELSGWLGRGETGSGPLEAWVVGPIHAPRSQAAASEPGPSAHPQLSAASAASAPRRSGQLGPPSPTRAQLRARAGQGCLAKPAPQPGRWVDRDCNAALDKQCIGVSGWRALARPAEAAIQGAGSTLARATSGCETTSLKPSSSRLLHSSV